MHVIIVEQLAQILATYTHQKEFPSELLGIADYSCCVL